MNCAALVLICSNLSVFVCVWIPVLLEQVYYMLCVLCHVYFRVNSSQGGGGVYEGVSLQFTGGGSSHHIPLYGTSVALCNIWVSWKLEKCT